MSTPTLEAAPVAATSTTTTASGARAVQLAIRAQLLIAVTKLWPALDPKRLDQTWPGWLRAMQLLVGSYHGQSSVAAGAFYRAARQDALDAPTPSSLIKLAPKPSDGWTAKAFGFSGPGMLTRDKVRPNTALTTTLGTASRIALDGGRTTIINTTLADKVAVGWYRVTSRTPCGFCAMLSGRLIAYKSEKSADFLSHGNCACSAAPAFSRDAELPAINTEAAALYRTATKGAPKGGQLAAFRKAWDARTP